MSTAGNASHEAAPPPAPEVAIVIPTFEERANVAEIAARLERVLGSERYELIFVDDHSPDGTADAVRTLARQDSRIRVIERIGRRGLSSAVIEGVMATAAPFAVVIDGDLQHDETAIPALLAALRGGADVAVGSRYLAGGGTGDWSERRRQVSFLATRMSQLVPAVRISDPMSGFFAMRTAVFRSRADQLVGAGYKILLDLLATRGAALEIREVAYVFRPRERGESKLDSRVAMDFAKLLLAKTAGRVLPVRFVMFLAVGAVGVGVHFLVLALLFSWEPFGISQLGATFVAMTGNFLLNNWFTYSDRRLTGSRLLSGWLSFCAASSVGLIANTGVAVYLFSHLNAPWYLAALAGILVGATWNYVSTALFTWKA